ncbi:hypothetical protein FF36_00339 [Frankia torreyi]|uniref:Uncharacterized protein n=1 Tax=Frankia torreyi TaxID=1856 RepID=A0A0D8BM68_9ACTN|nr:hypothetical protein FF36_00339 [Frankia torreyi]KQM07978.1 hypothetical protein FF86_1001234 [Frankia sp. CpI1-P]
MALPHPTARSTPPARQPESARPSSTARPVQVGGPAAPAGPPARARLDTARPGTAGPGRAGPAGDRHAGGRPAAGGAAGSPCGTAGPGGGAAPLPPSVARVAARTRLSAELLAAILEVERRTRATLDDIERADALAERLLVRRGHRLRATGGRGAGTSGGPAAGGSGLSGPSTAASAA